MEKLKAVLKKKWFLAIAVLIVIGAIFGSSKSDEKVNDKKVNNDKKVSETKVESKKEVVLVDFSSMIANDIVNWCQDNNLECNTKEEYSDTIEKGSFVSQSVKSGDKTYEGSKITVVYSLGKEPTREYRNALSKAESYARTMHMSKQAVYDQLISPYGEKFPSDAADYAIENLVADWNANALAKAKTYQGTMNMSTSAVYDQLVSQYGEQFTAEEAQYAIDHLND